MRYEIRLTPRALPQFLVTRNSVVTHTTYQLTWALDQHVAKVLARLSRINAEVAAVSASTRPTIGVIWHKPAEEPQDELD